MSVETELFVNNAIFCVQYILIDTTCGQTLKLGETCSAAAFTYFSFSLTSLINVLKDMMESKRIANLMAGLSGG